MTKIEQLEQGLTVQVITVLMAAYSQAVNDGDRALATQIAKTPVKLRRVELREVSDALHRTRGSALYRVVLEGLEDHELNFQYLELTPTEAKAVPAILRNIKAQIGTIVQSIGGEE